MNESFIAKLKKVHLVDLLHLIICFLAIFPALLYRLKRRHLWLVCEWALEAQDNGYAFYKYLRTEQPQTDVVYAISSKSASYAKVARLGEVVEYGSMKHWIYYLAAEVNISSQKGGKPNTPVCYLLEVVFPILKNKRVFLQHGVTKDDVPFLHRDRANFWMFCCAAKPEYEFVKAQFGYLPDTIKHLGFCRFDSFYERVAVDKHLLLIFPTWRMWLERIDDVKAFRESYYYKNWQKLLNSQAFDALLQKNDMRAVFCVHRNMMKYEHLFTTASSHIEIKAWNEADIAGLIKNACLMITDYSSTAMDFAYMEKPVIYYQFDKEEFRKRHLPSGYFEYERDGFGPVCRNNEEVIDDFRNIATIDFQMADVYKQRTKQFFTIRDNKNCERTYLAIREMLQKH